MIYECTDCEHCANFNFGFRVFCMHPDFSPDEVCKYHPVDEGNAEDCIGFEEGEPEDFYALNIFSVAEKFSEEKYGDVTYQGIREWVEQNTKRRK
jgi:hypothetical protein